MAAATVRRVATRVPCADGLSMGLDIYGAEGASAPLPVTVVCHGFKGFKDWGFFPPLCERLAARGRALAVFDFSHNGVGERPGEFDRLDLFARQTLSRHVQDLGTVLDFLDGADITREANLQRARHFNVVGHSFGGAVAVLRAAEDARITQVTTLNGVAELQRFTPEQAAEGRRTGKIAVKNQRTGQDMPLDVGFLDDAARHDLEGAATQIFVPALVIQGEADPGVTPAEGRQLNEWIPGSRLVLVPGADHVFGAKHPFAGWTPALEQVARELDAFLPHVGRLGGI
jgi:pimeloyl-ACP methyl ester carboxylesterase